MTASPRPRKARARNATPSSNGKHPPTGLKPLPDGLPLTTAAVAASAPMTWLWEGRLCDGGLAVLDGKKATGKSTIAAALAAAVTGGPRPPGWAVRRPRRVLWVGAEESFGRVVAVRLAIAGADLSAVHAPDFRDDRNRPRRLRLPSMMPELADLFGKLEPALLVLDPFSSLADDGLALTVEQEARRYLEPLADLCLAHDCTALLIRHVKKDRHASAIDAGLGSVAVGNVARSVLRVEKHPTDDDLSVLAVVAVNGCKRPPALLFRVEDAGDGPRLVWEGESALDPETLAEGRGCEGDRDELKDANKLLRAMLEGGPRQAGELQREAEQAGVSIGRLRRAKAELRVRTERRSMGNEGAGGWFWHPPAGGFPPAK